MYICILNFSSCHTITYTANYLILTVQLGILRYATGRYCYGFGRVGLSWQRRFTRQAQMIKNLLYGNVMCSLYASLQNDFVQGNQRVYFTFIQHRLALILQTRNRPLGITGEQHHSISRWRTQVITATTSRHKLVIVYWHEKDIFQILMKSELT